MYQHINTNTYFLALDVIPSFEKVCLKLKIKSNSFASQVLWKIYREIFIYPKDCKEMYDNFYSVEYDSVADYLFITTGFYIKAKLLEKKHILLIKADMQLLNENNENAYFNKILELLSEEI